MAVRKKMRENEKKFRELVLYISQKCANDPRFGATKLNKILFYSDFLSYALTGNPITGFEYQKLPNGPAPRRLLPVREAMVRDEELALQDITLSNGMTQKRTVNLRNPKPELFGGREIALVDEVIQRLSPFNATEVSELSHQRVGWIAASDNETIPYETIFISNQPLTEEEAQRGRRVAAKHASLTASCPS
jgi:hypothetical protein